MANYNGISNGTMPNMNSNSYGLVGSNRMGGYSNNAYNPTASDVYRALSQAYYNTAEEKPDRYQWYRDELRQEKENNEKRYEAIRQMRNDPNRIVNMARPWSTAPSYDEIMKQAGQLEAFRASEEDRQARNQRYIDAIRNAYMERTGKEAQMRANTFVS